MKLFLSTFLSMLTLFAIGQYEYYVPSPQTSDFVKYGNLPVSHYTGNLNLQVPIYNYSDKDFNIDVSLGFNSSGFVANKQPGIVGMNWFLNAGGAITRSIKGVPDDFEKNVSLKRYMNGLWVGLKRDANTYLTSEIYNFTRGDSTLHLDWVLGSTEPNHYETTSDIYTFNFTGYSGKFIIGPDKIAHVFNTESPNTFDIDLSGYSDQHGTSFYPNNNSTIIIKTGDGCKYTFGGSIEKLEYSMEININDPLDSPAVPHNPTIVSWHLKEIESPNGRKVIFEYRPFTLNPLSLDTYNYILSRYPKSYSEHFDTYTSYSLLVSKFSSSGYVSEDPNYELLKTVYLNKIKIGVDFEISFNYSEKGKKFYQTLVMDPSLARTYGQKNLKLDNIVVKSYGNTIKNADFTYSYKGSLNKERLFLDAVQITGMQPHTFSYVTGNFPSPTTRGMDYWGFWKGVDDETYALIPSLSLDELGNLSYTNDKREPNTSTGIFNLGLLNKVTYPTGGYTLIEYEPHRFTQKLDRRSDNAFLPKLYTTTESYAGGARVKKITDYIGTSQYNEREFIYKNNYNPNVSGSGTSSGVLLNWPRYIYAFSSTFYPEHNATNVVQTNSLGISINATDNEYITYSHVVEKKTDNSYTEFQYSDYVSNPDDVIQGSMNTWITNNYITEPYNFYVNIYRQPNCKSYERGKLKKKISYSSNGYPVSEESFIYNRSVNENYVASILLSGDKFYSRKDYTYQYVLKYDTIKNYSLNADGTYSSSFIQSVSEYDYNSFSLLSLKKTQKSNNLWNSEKYYYPHDYTSVENCSTLIYNHIIAKPIDVRTYNGTRLISGEQTKYNDYGQPTDLYNFESSATDIAFSTTNPFTFTHKQTIAYDAYKKPIKVNSDNDIYTHYIWGYNKQYPVAKIVTPLDTTISIIVEDISLSKSDLLASIKNDVLYLKGLLPFKNKVNYQVTIYTYKPLVGMTSQTDPTGITTYFQYDSFGRLEFVKDHDEKLLKKNVYHYSGM